MKCPKNTQAYKELIKVVSTDTALQLFSRYDISPDIMPFSKAGNGKPSKLFGDALEKFGNSKNALKIVLKARTDKYKQTHGDWELDRSLYSKGLDLNGEPLLEDVVGSDYINLNENEIIIDPRYLLKGFNELETSAVLDYGESKVLEGFLNSGGSMLNVLKGIEQELLNRKKTIQNTLKKGGLPKNIQEIALVQIDKIDLLLETENLQDFGRLLKNRLISEGYTEEKIREGEANDSHLSSTEATQDDVQEGTIAEDNKMIESRIEDETMEGIWNEDVKMSKIVSDTTGFLFKTYLMNIPLKKAVIKNGKKEYVTVTNLFGLPKTVNHKIVYNKASAELAGFYGTLEQRIDKLKNSLDPVLVSVSEALNNKDIKEFNRFRALFYMATNLQEHNLKTVKVYEKEAIDYNDVDLRVFKTKEAKIINTDSSSLYRRSQAAAESYLIGQFQSSNGSDGILKLEGEVFYLDANKLKVLSDRIEVLRLEYFKLIKEIKNTEQNKVLLTEVSTKFFLDNSGEFMDILNNYGIKIKEAQYYVLITEPLKYFKGKGVKVDKLKSLDPAVFISKAHHLGLNFIYTLARPRGLDITSPFVNEDTSPLEDSTIKTLLKNLYKDSTDNVEQTFLNSSNNQVATFGLPSYLTQVFKKIRNLDVKTLQDYSKADFSSTSRIIEMLKNPLSGITSDDIEIGIFDALSLSKNAALMRSNTSKIEKLLIRISLIGNNGDTKHMWLTPLTFSDKKRVIMVKLPKLKLFTAPSKEEKMEGKKVFIKGFMKNKDGSNVYTNGSFRDGIIGDTITNDETNNALLRLVKGEIRRINRVNKLLKNNATDIEKSWLNGGNSFMLFPSLNKILKNNPSLMVEETIAENKNTLDILLNEVHKDIAYEIREVFNTLTENKSAVDISNMLSKKYIETLGIDQENLDRLNTYFKEADDVFKYKSLMIAIDLVVNNIVGTGDLVQLMADPAQFTKGSDEDGSKEFLTWSTYLKRLGSIIGTGMEAQSTIYEKVNGEMKLVDYNEIEYIVLKDMKTARFYKDYVDTFGKLFGKAVGEQVAKAYSNVNATDAQEFVTLKKYIVDKAKRGKISEDVFNRINNKIMKAYKENKDVILDSEDISEIVNSFEIEPQKPLYTNFNYDAITNSNSFMIVKSSYFPLIANLTNGLEIDILRKEMEKRERSFLINEDGTEVESNRKTISAAFISAVKVGARVVNDIYDYTTINGIVSATNINPLKVEAIKSFTISYEGSKIQQEEGNHEDFTTLTVSQLNQLIHLGTLDIQDFKDKEGKIINGKDLKKKKQSIKKELIKRSTKKFAIEAGLGLDKEGIIDSIRDVVKFRDYFRNILEKEGISENELQALKFTNGEFTWPLDMSTARNKIVQKINAKISKSILRPKIRGRSFIQGSGVGIKKLISENDDKVKAGSLTGSIKNEVIYTKSFQGELKMLGLNKDNSVRRMQVIIPWIFKQKIEDFVDKNGFIDMTKIDKDLLTLIGSRIPNQGFSSMTNIEIVGFLPEGYKSLILLPDEITTQMGSDFDVDHLYTYAYNYKEISIDDVTKLVKTTLGNAENMEEETQALENQYVDIHDIILSHPTIVARMVESLDLEDFKDFANTAKKKEMKEYTEGGKRFIPLGITYSEREYINAQAGKSGVAIQANALVFLAMAEGKNLTLLDEKREKVTINFFDKGEITTLDTIDLGYYEYKGESRTNAGALQMLLSESVDNANNGNLAYLGYDLVNSGVYNLLLSLVKSNKNRILNKSLSATVVALIMTQPAIVEITAGLKDLTKKIGKRTKAQDVDIINNVIQKYSTNKTSSFNKEQLENKTLEMQYYAAKVFKDLYFPSRTIGIVNSVLKIETKGIGKDLESVLQKERLFNELLLGDNMDITNLADLLFDDKRHNSSFNEIGESLNLALKASKVIWGSSNMGLPNSLVMHSSFNKLLDKALEVNPFLKYQDYVKVSKLLHEGFLSYVVASHNEKSSLFIKAGKRVNLNSLRITLLFGTNSLANRIREYNETNNPVGSYLLSNLNLNFNVDLTQPSLITLNSFGFTDNSERMMTASWMELYRGDLKQKELALDLLRYSVLEGAKFSPLSIKKVRPLNLLIEVGHGDAVNSFDFESLNYDELYLSIIRNNPEIVPPMSVIGIIKEVKETIIENGTKYNKTTKTTKYDQSSYYPYVHVKFGNTYALFKGSIEGDIVKYNSVVTGGSRVFYEVSPNETGFISAFSNSYEKVNLIANAKKELPIAVGGDGISHYFTRGFKGRTAMITALNNLKTLKLKPVINIIKDMQWLLSDNVSLEIDDKIKGRGKYYNNVISINPKAMANSKIKGEELTYEIEKTIVHELLHSQLDSLVIAYKASNLIGDKYRDLRIALGNIEKVRIHLETKYRKEVDLIKAKRKDGVALQLEEDLYFYPLTDLKEFMVAISSSEFISKHKDEAYLTTELDKQFPELNEANNTFLGAIFKYMKNLFEALIGTNLKNNTALYEVFGNYFVALNIANKLKEQSATTDSIIDTLVYEGKTYGIDRFNRIFDIRENNMILERSFNTPKIAVAFKVKKYPDKIINFNGKELFIDENYDILDIETGKTIYNSNKGSDVTLKNLVYKKVNINIENNYTKSHKQKSLEQNNIKISIRGKMTSAYGNSKRSDVKSITTLEAVKSNERTAITGYKSDGHTDYWKKLKIGDVIEWEGQKGEKVLVEVTKPLHDLVGSNKTAEQWSKLEGWSINYFNSKVKPKLNEAWQIEYKLIESGIIREENKIVTQGNLFSQEQQKNTPKYSSKESPLQIYVDGSDFKGTGNIGYGAYFKYKGNEYTLSGALSNADLTEIENDLGIKIEGEMSNYTMELYGSLKAIQSVPKNEHIKILQDLEGVQMQIVGRIIQHISKMKFEPTKKGKEDYAKWWKALKEEEQESIFNEMNEYVTIDSNILAKSRFINWEDKNGKNYSKFTRGQHAQENYTAAIINKIIDEIVRRKGKIEYEWIKGHKGIEGNEKADKVAKDRNNYNGFKELFGESFSPKIEEIKEEVINAGIQYKNRNEILALNELDENSKSLMENVKSTSNQGIFSKENNNKDDKKVETLLEELSGIIDKVHSKC